MRHVVVVGAGLAGFRVGRSLRDAGFTGEITLIGDEEHLPYDRPPLSKALLAGSVTGDQCRLPGRTDDLTWRLGAPVHGVDFDVRALTLGDGTDQPFDELVIATGRRARPWPGRKPATGVFTLRSLGDVAAFTAAAAPGSRVVIIGAGFIGCEVAATLRARDVEVTVVDVSDTPMPVIGPEAGAFARQLHERHGVRWRLGTGVDSIEGDEYVTGVRLADGELLEADAVLVSIGSVPNTEWLADSPVDTDGGVVHVDDICRVLDRAGSPLSGVWAAGDVAAWVHPHAGTHVCVEHWSNARDMADRVAANLVVDHPGRAPLVSVPAFWSDQYDVKIKSVGYLRAADELVVVAQDADRNSLVVEARRGSEVVGAIGFNATKAVLGYQRALRAVPA
ncbi:NAD(P)/FAD-dependent oxidoreductase [Rhodococcus sp. T7]|uniref:NAD(P)/FAD-dependent oxidoreductase n=1 Tax=Rhodococcus sp. T7 TaxID=627444 RepID=UPI00135CEE6B|nr:FAD-dependent oxidoreductase [Rhodococcus sp. T7]KAF0957005.1 Rhodocoxin reductase [Rhodococcus sp. T7]KAF0958710.1 Rhodocoxin reductase [Rhodococcus sp. T7]